MDGPSPPESAETAPGPPEGSPEDLWARGSRRAFALILAPSAFLFALEGIFESDKWTHILDDEIVAAAALVALVYFLVKRNLVGSSELARGNRLATIAGVFIAGAAVLAFFTEGNDPMDIGNDPPTLLLGALVVANGYIAFGTVAGVSSAELPPFGKELGRLRGSIPVLVFLFMIVIYFIVGSFFYPVSVGGKFSALGLVITLVVGGAAVAGFALLALNRNQRNVRSLHRTNDVLAVLGALCIVLTVVTGTFPIVVFAAPLLVNRFV